eukprot:2531172-Heterocapsa_arctica.AAC.1
MVETADPSRGTALRWSASPDLSLRLALTPAVGPGSDERPAAESARLAFVSEDWALARAASMAALVSPLEPVTGWLCGREPSLFLAAF